MKSLDIYNTSLPSSLSRIGKVVDEFITNLQKSCGTVDDCTIFELRVILNEVLINAIRHGNGEDVSKVVKVNASISEQGTVSIIVEDEGCGYDYNYICGCHKPLQGMTDPLDTGESGRGIMIVRSLCNNVEVNAKGNKIILTKKITSIEQ